MYLEILLITAISAACALPTLLALRPAPSPRPWPSAPTTPARHRRDRYSVASIRARIEHERAGGGAGVAVLLSADRGR
ncbi:hypothetical protein ACFXHA_15545 [Nocardia sp. NPDC059240]|uniref:hypothetical protein n=1 Tax=Nocardia sp. NPDC059240 TaxID=3346786 RepID=UPI003685DBDC